jgi:hypothetical protein
MDISLAKSQVDIYAVPEKPIADGLIDAYFATVHPLFPIIHRPSFMSQYELFFTRARILGALDGGVLFGIATLHDVQTMGLIGMYFLSGKQTNRYAVTFHLIPS